MKKRKQSNSRTTTRKLKTFLPLTPEGSVISDNSNPTMRKNRVHTQCGPELQTKVYDDRILEF